MMRHGNAPVGRTLVAAALVSLIGCKSSVAEQPPPAASAKPRVPLYADLVDSTAKPYRERNESLREQCLVLHDKDACCKQIDPLDGDVPYACCQDPASTECQYPKPRARPR